MMSSRINSGRLLGSYRLRPRFSCGGGLVTCQVGTGSWGFYAAADTFCACAAALLRADLPDQPPFVRFLQYDISSNKESQNRMFCLLVEASVLPHRHAGCRLQHVVLRGRKRLAGAAFTAKAIRRTELRSCGPGAAGVTVAVLNVGRDAQPQPWSTEADQRAEGSAGRCRLGRDERRTLAQGSRGPSLQVRAFGPRRWPSQSRRTILTQYRAVWGI